jgi:1-acyl-sn-glycerol-3-phosphate acyltransferase
VLYATIGYHACDMIHLRNIFWTFPLIVLATALMGTLSLLVSLFSSTGHAQHTCAKMWSRMLLWAARITLEVEGLDKIPPGGTFVFVANHRSYFDVPVVLPYISVQFRFFAKKSLFSVPFIGYHLRRAGHLMVDSSNPRESLKSMAEAARAIPEKGISILLFPEGHRTKGEMGAFKDGAAYIAIKAGVPIVPIGITGTTRILPPGSLKLRGGKVKMRIGDPIPTIDIPLGDRTRLTQVLYQRIQELTGFPPSARAA